MNGLETAGSGGEAYGFLSWDRPKFYWDVVVAHLPVALVTGIALLLPHLVPCHLLPLKKCTFLSLTGYPCPFCGLTRSFWAIAHGDWAFAIHNAPLACLIYVATALLFAWHLTGLMIGLKVAIRLRHLLLSRPAIGLMATMVILNWAYRLASGLE